MMKFTLGWLKEHLDTDRPLGEILDKLTMIGLEVERVEDRGKTLAPFVIASVVEAKQHPNADRLRVCMVDTGSGDPVQVVCGAPNARAGMKGVFVPPGAYIPGKDITLLELDTEALVARYHRVSYDVEGAAGAIVAAGLPGLLAERLEVGR